MKQAKVMDIIREHGLYCVELTNSGLIGLTDRSGNVYDVIIVTPSGLITDENTTMSLADWLGYETL